MEIRTVDGSYVTQGRRAVAHPRGGLGNSISPTGGPGGLAATVSTRYTTPGQPIYNDFDATAATRQGYLGHTYVMRCVRLRAETLAGLPFRSGPDPDNPSTWDPNARLSQLLGPATVGAPGGPSPDMTSRAFIIWSWIQYIVTGRMAWQIRPDNGNANDPIQSLWPLVSAALDPVASAPGIPKWFDGYVYHTPMADLPLKDWQVAYHWRMSAEDPRQSESVLQAASLPIQLAVALDKYMWGLISRGMVASKLVLAPPFEEPSSERAWQEQFLSMFSGYDKSGSTIFATVEADEDESTGKAMQSVQVIDLSMKGTDAQMLETVSVAKSDINIALGVPVSLIGNASERIYSNADAEERVFWTTTAINDVEEFQDAVNLRLAPQLDPNTVGWFDLSRVASLQPPTIFQPPAITDAINLGIITADQAADLLGIPAHSGGGEDTTTAPIGEVTAGIGAADTATGGRSIAYLMERGRRTQSREDIERGQRGMEVLSSLQLPDGFGFRHRSVTTHSYRAGNAGWGIVRKPRSRFRIAPSSGHRAEVPELASEVLDTVLAMQRKRRGAGEGVRSDAMATKLFAVLSENYPESTLDWVKHASWQYQARVPLSKIDMARRPGGRDQAKVTGIAKAIADGKTLDPIVLVDNGSGKFAVADGYHRLLAYQHANKTAVAAYVASGVGSEGPWDDEMHAEKLNTGKRALEDFDGWFTDNSDELLALVQ